MKEKTTIEIGKELEHLVASKFQEIGYQYARRSSGSGNKNELGDISGQDIMVVECKKRNTKDVTLKSDVWRKLVESIPLHSERKAMYVLGNKEKEVWCVMSLDDMFTMIKGWHDYYNPSANGL
jgi:Holliday junction resolvase